MSRPLLCPGTLLKPRLPLLHFHPMCTHWALAVCPDEKKPTQDLLGRGSQLKTLPVINPASSKFRIYDNLRASRVETCSSVTNGRDSLPARLITDAFMKMFLISKNNKGRGSLLSPECAPGFALGVARVVFHSPNAPMKSIVFPPFCR